MRRRPRAWPMVLLAFTMCPQISRSELACEEAKARLIRCCPGFSGQALGCVDSSDEPYGCDDVQIDLADARCVTDRGCAELVETGVCERALEKWDLGSTSTTWNANVCLP